MAKMTKNQLIDAIAEGTQISKNDVRSVIEQMATVGYKELNESGEFVIPGFAKMSVVHKPATEARSGVNPFTKEPMEFAAKPASKSVKASPLKVEPGTQVLRASNATVHGKPRWARLVRLRIARYAS